MSPYFSPIQRVFSRLVSFWKEECSGPKKNLGDFSNRSCMSASRDYFVALSRLHSCVPVIPDELERLDILLKHDFILDNMNNPDRGLEVG